MSPSRGRGGRLWWTPLLSRLEDSSAGKDPWSLLGWFGRLTRVRSEVGVLGFGLDPRVRTLIGQEGAFALSESSAERQPRTAEIARETRETKIQLSLNLDGTGRAEISSGVGFLDHMLELFARHGLMDLKVVCQGDVQVDDHHTTEDIGICLGQAIDRALGNRAGIFRYGHMILPMDEALVTCAVDLGGRPFWVWNAPMPSPKIGTFDSELIADFWQAVCTQGRMNLHVLLHYGRNTHHISEAIFKGMARALRAATERDPRNSGVPSTKGSL